MGKYIGRIYKHSQSKLSTTSIKAPVLSYLDSLTPSYTELTITSVYSGIDKKQKKLFCVPKIPPRMI